MDVVDRMEVAEPNKGKGEETVRKNLTIKGKFIYFNPAEGNAHSPPLFLGYLTVCRVLFICVLSSDRNTT